MQKRNFIILLALILVVITLAFASIMTKQKNEVPKGDKVISVTIINKDKTQKLFKISTTSKTLGGALLQRNLITAEEYKTGNYTFINGIRADSELDGGYWRFTKSGEIINITINDVNIKDGDCFEITYTPK